MRGLLVAQFFGAFNDNAWKMIVIALALGAGTATGEESQRQELLQTTLAFLALTVPLMLVSLPAGALSDRVSKRSVILWMKMTEFALMSLGAVVLFFLPGNTAATFGVLALMGVQSAIFSPAKYGILPEILPAARLSSGNGLLELWTFVAIIAGTAVAGPMLGLAEGLSEESSKTAALAPFLLAILAIVGWHFARSIPRVPAARAEGGVAETIRSARQVIREDRVLRLSICGQCFYWGIASLVGAVVIVFGKAEPFDLGKNAGILLAVFGLGVGGGSVLAGKLSRDKVEYGLIPLGAMGLASFLFLLGLCSPTLWFSFVLMVGMGVSSGLIVVPLNALLQSRSPEDRRGAVIAFANVLVFGGMIAGNLVGLAMSELGGLPARGVLVGAAVLTAAGTIWSLKLLPDAFLRLVLVLLTHTFYRVTVRGARKVPQEGGALLVPNHVSFVDGLFLLASVDRRVRFLVDSSYFKHRIYGPFLRSLGALEISSAGGPRVVLKAMRDAGKYLEEGEVVCIFAEGQLSRTGTLQPFQRGLERIVRGRDAVVVPVFLDRVWGSIFSRDGGRFLTKIPKRVPYPVTVAIGDPLPSDTSVAGVRQAVVALGEEAWAERKKDRPPLPVSMVRVLRSHPFRLAFADPTRDRVSSFGALTAAVAVAEKLRTSWSPTQNVGILLPPSVAGATVNLAASLSGKTTVNLNYTVGVSALESAVRQSEIKTVVTSRAFLEAADIELPDNLEPIWIEDIAATIGASDKLRAALRAALTPARRLVRSLSGGRDSDVDEVATIIFSSGSTGDPKGVLLTHFNIDSNVEGVGQVMRVDKHDRMLGILPHFHSFGYMALWFAIQQGVGTVFLPNPLDAAAVGEMVQRHRVTILIATPTFLQVYMRRCTPAQFGSLRIVLAGAEKLNTNVSQAFEDFFGIRPLEGYGTTECAPAIAISSLDFRAPGFYQPGSRRGSVGQILPGVAVRVVDPEDHSVEREAGESGMLLVKGPNVMKGYLGRDDLTSEVLRDGWYTTGDIAYVDEHGFLFITDRLSRFSKIGGEMVPHGKVEQALHTAAESDVQIFAVTAVPDERKGERLAVLSTIEPDRVPAIVDKLGEIGLPNLFIPRVDSFVAVEQLPLLGTGKLDLREMKRLASEALTDGPKD